MSILLTYKIENFVCCTSPQLHNFNIIIYTTVHLTRRLEWQTSDLTNEAEMATSRSYKWGWNGNLQILQMRLEWLTSDLTNEAGIANFWAYKQLIMANILMYTERRWWQWESCLGACTSGITDRTSLVITIALCRVTRIRLSINSIKWRHGVVKFDLVSLLLVSSQEATQTHGQQHTYDL